MASWQEKPLGRQGGRPPGLPTCAPTANSPHHHNPHPTPILTHPPAHPTVLSRRAGPHHRAAGGAGPLVHLQRHAAAALLKRHVPGGRCFLPAGGCARGLGRALPVPAAHAQALSSLLRSECCAPPPDQTIRCSLCCAAIRSQGEQGRPTGSCCGAGQLLLPCLQPWAPPHTHTPLHAAPRDRCRWRCWPPAACSLRARACRRAPSTWRCSSAAAWCSAAAWARRRASCRRGWGALRRRQGCSHGPRAAAHVYPDTWTPSLLSTCQSPCPSI